MTHTPFWNLSETEAQHATVLAPERRRSLIFMNFLQNSQQARHRIR
jgi:hypothetical protein